MFIDEIKETVGEFSSEWHVYGCAMYNLIKDWNCVASDIDCSECPCNKYAEIERNLRELYC